MAAVALLLTAAAALAPADFGVELRKVKLGGAAAAALVLAEAPGCELNAEEAAFKLATHVRDAAGRRDRHDAVCRRVAAACRARCSDVRRDAPLWRLGLDLTGPGRRRIDVSICRDGAWSFVEVTVRAFGGDATVAEAAVAEKLGKYADLPRVHVLAVDAVTGRAHDAGVFAALEAAGLVADGAALADAVAAVVVNRAAAPLLPRKRRRPPLTAPGLPRPRTRRERMAARAGGGGGTEGVSSGAS